MNILSIHEQLIRFVRSFLIQSGTFGGFVLWNSNDNYKTYLHLNEIIQLNIKHPWSGIPLRTQVLKMPPKLLHPRSASNTPKSSPRVARRSPSRSGRSSSRSGRSSSRSGRGQTPNRGKNLCYIMSCYS